MPDEEDFDAVDRDASIRNILGVGPEFAYEILSKEDWVGRRLVADRFRDRRIFIAGDAAHLWVPYAGYGMNAGIADALNLSWHLASHLAGWATEAAIDCLRDRAPGDHRAGLAFRHGPCGADDQGTRRRATAHRGARPGRRRDPRRAGPQELRAQRPAVLLRRPQLRLLLRPLAAHQLRRRGTTRLHHGRLHGVDGGPVAGRRTSGSATADRSTTGSAPTTRCCASTRRPLCSRCSTPPRRAPCRSRCSTCHALSHRPSIAMRSSCAAPTSTWPGVATRARRILRPWSTTCAAPDRLADDTMNA